MFAFPHFVVWLFSDFEFCSRLVLDFAVTLPLPAPEVLGAGIKTELLRYVDILTTHLVPALAFSLIVRKLTS